jgi:Dihaem cytochrome c
MQKKYVIFSGAVIFLLVVFFVSSALLDAEENRHQGRSRHGYGKNRFKPVANQAYKTTCGECHSPYSSELLPGSSWKKILNQSKDHFGEQIPLETSSKEIIGRYLTQNGADRSSSRKAVKIMISLKGKTPLRITEIPYIREKHHEITKEVLNRKTIGSLSNCMACHKTADLGCFNENSVVIPR